MRSDVALMITNGHTVFMFHPDLRAARWLPRAAVGRRSLPLIRFASSLGRPRPGPTVVPLGPGCAVRVHRPASAAAPVGALLWIHGGGFIIGSAGQDDALCRRFVEELGIIVASVEYRLAPEHPYPAPLEDCYTALAWLAAQEEVDPARIVIGGASAGGGLAAGLALLAHERAAVTPALQLLVYPMLDDRTALRTDVDEAHVRMWNNRSNRFGWQSYLGRPPGSPDVPPLAAPARYEDLAGLPPAWIGVGTLDLFHDEDVAYAQRLRQAGVACQLDVVTGAFHGFDAVLPKAPVSRSFVAAQIAAVAGALV
jgi:acetyl esterase/lipase